MNQFSIGPASLRKSFAPFLLALPFILSSCGFIPLGSKTEFEPKTEGVTIMISENEEGPYQEVTEKKIKLNHYKKKYFLKQSKPGFLDWSGEVTRTRANHLRRLDILTASSNTVAMTILVVPKIGVALGQFDSYPFSDIGMYSMIGITVAQWGAIGAMPS